MTEGVEEGKGGRWKYECTTNEKQTAQRTNGRASASKSSAIKGLFELGE